jgi:hypothetical protein
MRKITLVFALQILFVGVYAQLKSQTLTLRTGKVNFPTGFSKASIDSFNAQTFPRFNQSILLLQFRSIPDSTSIKSLAGRGIVLLNYMGQYVYIASLAGRLKREQLQGSGIISFYPWLAALKTDPQLANGKVPAHAIKVSGTIDVQVTIPLSFALTEVESYLSNNHFTIIDRARISFGILHLRIDNNQLQELASLPFILYIEAIGLDPEPLNNKSRQLTNASVLNAPISEGGKGLNGEGVAIGIGDSGDMLGHIDFAGRLIVRTTFSDNHAIMVGGTAAAAGTVYELYRGFASRSTVISNAQSQVIERTSVYYRDYGMLVTNNSYGSANCEFNGAYDVNSNYTEKVTISSREVLHVFAAGNSGVLACAPYPTGFSTLASGFQCAKNVLTVGATNDTAEQALFTSRGPTKDGRIKPEIMAAGVGVITASGANVYAGSTGTSIAAPAVTGGAALLYQRYHQLNNNNNPQHGLIKAVLCNGADDRGNPGPDFTYGFGSMNLLRSVDMIEQNHYYISSISNGATTSHTIPVPSNTAQLKVMLYWADPAALPPVEHTLINDLDMELATPANTTILPLVLDTIPANVNQPALNKADHINNIEQVVIDHPAEGSYTVRVKGTTIPQGPQEYFVVYDVVPVSLNITYPTGGEALVPGETMKIRWDAFGNPVNDFALEYSIDNGSNWTAIAATISPVSRAYSWQVPNVVSENAKIRIKQNGTGLSSITQRFTIIGLPVVTLDPQQCEGSVAIQWTAVPGATDYEVMMLGGDEMKRMAITTATSWFLNSLSADTVYWVTVRARLNERNGRRAIAISRQPNTGDCSSSMYDNDLKLDSILTPQTGRRFTSTALGTETIKVRIKNLDNTTVNGFVVKYSLDGIVWQAETLNTPIVAGASYEHVFTQPVNLSTAGSYTITAVVKNLAADPITRNDTCRSVVRQLDNQPILLNATTAFVDDLEATPDTSYVVDTRGLTGIDRYDFENATAGGELRSFANSDVASSGRNSFILGERFRRPISSRGSNVVTGTFNLAGKSVLQHDIRLNFRYLVNSGGTNNDVWIRGSDIDPWIRVFDFNANLSPITATAHKYSDSLRVTDTLAKYGQEFSSSFQVRWRESGYVPNIPGVRMFSIDDIGLSLKGSKIDEALIGRVYPNPSTGKYTVVLQLPLGEQVSARIINISGQLIRSYKWTGVGVTENYDIDLSSSASGIYILQLSGSGKTYFKLVKIN